jgi:N-hydroxyarylamine O-acetyltransferase
MAGAVMREVRGDAAVGNHLVLLVKLDRLYVADVGFGDGLIEPVPLAEGAISQRRLAFRLEELGQGWWRFHNSPGGGAPSFDFEVKRADETLLDERCIWLQTSTDSPFVQNAVVQRHAPEGLSIMRGRVLKTLGENFGARNIVSAADYVDTLSRVFGLSLPDAALLWPKIEARHREVFGEA